LFAASPLDPYASAIQLWLNEGRSRKQIADLLLSEFGVETSDTSVRRAIERHDLEVPDVVRKEGERAATPGLEIKGDLATVTSDVSEDLGDLDGIVRNRGLNPKDWVVEKVTVNEWDSNAGGGDIIRLQQLKVYLKRHFALQFITPASPVKVFNRPSPPKFARNESALAVIAGDEQEPYSDPHVKQSFLRMLEKVQPNIFVHLGDVMDLPTISRHKDNPEWAASVQECLNTGYATLRAYREASPDTRMIFLVGNHDERIRNELLLRAERMYGIRAADKPGQEEEESALSIRRLLRLDELQIEFIDPHGGYAHAQFNLSNQLGVRHGWLTGGNTAGKTLDRLGHSIVVGHTHAQRLNQKTLYSIDGTPKVLTAVEAGTLSQVKGGIGYAVNPDWQQGFVTASVWEDGSFKLDLATYTDGALRWRSDRF